MKKFVAIILVTGLALGIGFGFGAVKVEKTASTDLKVEQPKADPPINW